LNAFKSEAAVSYTVAMYLIYLGVAVTLTIWVAHNLSRYGRAFLVDVFGGDSALAASIDRLLVIGFYLLTLGAVAVLLRVSDDIGSVRGVIETLSLKLGGVLGLLGVAHLTNVGVLTLLRARNRSTTPAPVYAPFAPTAP
jgi:hypothetical protein